MIWILTLYLAGMPIYEERDAQWKTWRQCMDRGWELVRVYKQDHLIVIATCESTVESEDK